MLLPSPPLSLLPFPSSPARAPPFTPLQLLRNLDAAQHWSRSALRLWLLYVKCSLVGERGREGGMCTRPATLMSSNPQSLFLDPPPILPPLDPSSSPSLETPHPTSPPLPSRPHDHPPTSSPPDAARRPATSSSSRVSGHGGYDLRVVSEHAIM